MRPGLAHTAGRQKPGHPTCRSVLPGLDAWVHRRPGASGGKGWVFGFRLRATVTCAQLTGDGSDGLIRLQRSGKCVRDAWLQASVCHARPSPYTVTSARALASTSSSMASRSSVCRQPIAASSLLVSGTRRSISSNPSAYASS